MLRWKLHGKACAFQVSVLRLIHSGAKLASRAQVPCTDIIENARVSSSTDAAIQKLGKLPKRHSETGVQKVLNDNGCNVPVPVQYVDLPSQKRFPYVLTSDWIKFLAVSDRLHYLIGTKDKMERRQLCLEFWRRFELVRPAHPVFAMARAGQIDLCDTWPLLHHGDEGRSFRKLPIMILSTHGVLGAGCSQAADGNKADYPMDENPMRLNFLGSTMTTHFIFAAAPQCVYKKHPEALDTLLEIYANDMRELAMKGVTVHEGGRPKKLFFMCIAAKGDLPYLGKCGHMSRTYSKCPKKSVAKKPCDGICWRCLAGVEGRRDSWPWEHFSLRPKWLETVGVEPGFSCVGPLLAIPHDDPTLFYQADLWHSFHLGCGKSFVASAIVILLEKMDGFGSADDRLKVLSLDYKNFCKRTHKYGYISAINRDFLGWENFGDMPQGHWHKGFVTTRLLEWLEDYMDREHKNEQDPILKEIEPWSLKGIRCPIFKIMNPTPLM